MTGRSGRRGIGYIFERAQGGQPHVPESCELHPSKIGKGPVQNTINGRESAKLTYPKNKNNLKIREILGGKIVFRVG
jgi:hypothetical protein